MSIRWKLPIAVAVILLLSLITCWWLMARRVAWLIEEEIGSQMVVQAQITSHFVKVCKRAGMTNGAINGELQQICDSVEELGLSENRKLIYEFWITGSGGEPGEAVIRSLPLAKSPPFNFFTPKSDQPKPFQRLYADSANLGFGSHIPYFIQSAQKRDIDNEIYKYVGVSGLKDDEPRIVQVGYHAKPLLEKVQHDTTIMVALVSVVQLLGGAIVVWTMHRQIIRPLNRLTRGVQNLDKRQEFESERLERLKSRNDEVGHLARAVTDLAVRVREEAQEPVRLREFADRNRQIFLKIDHDKGIIKDCNSHALHVFECLPRDLIEKNMNVIIPEGSQEEVKDAVQDISENTIIDNFNENCTLNRKTRMWIHWRNRLIRDGDQSWMYSVGNRMDFLIAANAMRQNSSQFTEVLRFATEVQARNARQLEAVQNMKIFVDRTAHELKQPLHSIRTSTGLLMTDDNLLPEQQRMLRTIDQQAHVLFINIESLLNHSKIERGTLNLDPLPFSLRSMMDGVVAALASSANDKGLKLMVTVDDRLPDALIGDAVRIGQVITNLISNAIKFTKQGEIKVNIQNGKQAPEGNVEIVGLVSDTGAGIPSSQWESIFLPYEQVSRDLPGREGLGLGLTICRGILDLMHGTIAVESSSEEAGTTMKFSVPLKVTKASITSPALTQNSLTGSSPSILVVDDNAIDRKLNKSVLERENCKVATAATGEEALELIYNQHFDLVLLDNQLSKEEGKLFGTDVAARIHANPPAGGRPRIVLLSANASRTLTDGVDAIVGKGMAVGQWLSIVRDELRKPSSGKNRVDD